MSRSWLYSLGVHPCWFSFHPSRSTNSTCPHWTWQTRVPLFWVTSGFLFHRNHFQWEHFQWVGCRGHCLHPWCRKWVPWGVVAWFQPRAAHISPSSRKPQDHCHCFVVEQYPHFSLPPSTYIIIKKYKNIFKWSKSLKIFKIFEILGKLI